MSATDLAIVANQIQKYWAPKFTARLRESLLLGELVNKEYEGSIAKQGDTVKVSQLVDLNGQLTTVGVDADTFDTEQLATVQVDVTANKRALAAVEMPDLVALQSQIDQEKVMDTMMFAMNKQINEYLYSLVAPSSSAPDLQVASVATLGLTEIGAARQAAGEQKWIADGSWFALLSPKYWTDLLVNTTLASSLYVDDRPLVAGQKARRLLNFNMYEDNSRPGAAFLGSAAYTSCALFAHPDFVHFVRQTSVQVKLSDMHVVGKFAVKMSVDIVFGAALGNQGSLKHYTITT